MESIDLERLRRSARFRYERARARRALLGVVPVIFIVALAVFFAHRPFPTVWFGGATFAMAAILLWFGRDPRRAVLPGIVAGLVPLAFALCANQVHTCGMEHCSSLCVPACTLGGVIAGLAVASVANERRAGLWFWLSASGLALLTGAMGCACVGVSGVMGLAIGYAAGVAPGLLRRALRRRSL